MTGSLGDLVAQLIAVREKLDTAAVTATRARTDAEQALVHFTTAGRGSNDSSLAAAVVDARTAGEKTGRYARLLADASEALSRYLDTIAPGSSPSRTPTDNANPDGERLLSEAEARARKAEAFLRRHVTKADDTEDSLKQSEQKVTAGLKGLFQAFKKEPGPTGTSTSTPSSGPVTPIDRPQADHPVTSVIMAAGAVVVGVRGMWNTAKKRRERKNSDDQPRDDRLHPDDDQGRPRRQ